VSNQTLRLESNRVPLAGRRRNWPLDGLQAAEVGVLVERRISGERRVGERRRSPDRRMFRTESESSIPTYSQEQASWIQEQLATSTVRVGCPVCNGVLTVVGPYAGGMNPVYVVRCAACRRSIAAHDLSVTPASA